MDTRGYTLVVKECIESPCLSSYNKGRCTISYMTKSGHLLSMERVSGVGEAPCHMEDNKKTSWKTIASTRLGEYND